MFDIAILGFTKPAQAFELAEALLAQGNREPLLWEKAVALLRKLGRKADADALLLHAAKLSISPELSRQALPLHRTRRLTDVAPAEVTPGLLANELRWRLEEVSSTDPRGALKQISGKGEFSVARARLSPEGQTALDVATIYLMSAELDGKALIKLATDRILLAMKEGRNALWLGVATLESMESPHDLTLFVRALVPIKPPSTLIESILCLIAADAPPVLTRKIVPLVSSLLDAKSKALVLGVIKSRKLPDDMQSRRAILSDIRKLLLPEFDWLEDNTGADDDDDDDLLEELFEVDDDFDDGVVAAPTSASKMMGSSPGQLRAILAQIGLPERKLAKLTVSDLKELYEVIAACTLRPPTPRSMAQLVKAFERSGFSPKDFEKMIMRPPQSRRSKGIN